MTRVEVITGRERRRRWTEEQKRAIVAESFAPGAMVSDVARRADISSSQIYRWRQELRATPVSGFTPVLIASESPATNIENGCHARSSSSRGTKFVPQLRIFYGRRLRR
jgi:transposase-like protein